MPGNAPGRSPSALFVGLLATLLGVIGHFVFGWRFGADSGPVPVTLGVPFAVVAVGWTLYRRF